MKWLISHNLLQACKVILIDLVAWRNATQRDVT